MQELEKRVREKIKFYEDYLRTDVPSKGQISQAELIRLAKKEILNEILEWVVELKEKV